MKYRVHRFNVKGFSLDEDKLEQFLNDLKGEVLAIVPNIVPLPGAHIDRLLIVEQVYSAKDQIEILKEAEKVGV